MTLDRPGGSHLLCPRTCPPFFHPDFCCLPSAPCNLAILFPDTLHHWPLCRTPHSQVLYTIHLSSARACLARAWGLHGYLWFLQLLDQQVLKDRDYAVTETSTRTALGTITDLLFLVTDGEQAGRNLDHVSS